jgi:hypothetical protein
MSQSLVQDDDMAIVRSNLHAPSHDPVAPAAVELGGIPWGETLVAAIAQTFEEACIENILWGNMVLALYGVPTVVNVSLSIYALISRIILL